AIIQNAVERDLARLVDVVVSRMKAGVGQGPAARKGIAGSGHFADLALGVEEHSQGIVAVGCVRGSFDLADEDDVSTVVDDRSKGIIEKAPAGRGRNRRSLMGNRSNLSGGALKVHAFKANNEHGETQ